MGLIASAKGAFLKNFLDKLTHGDTGSTAIGAIAAGILACNVSLSDLFGSDQGKQMEAAGKIAGTVVIAYWGYRTGKK